MTEAPVFLTPVDAVTGELAVSSLPEAPGPALRAGEVQHFYVDGQEREGGRERERESWRRYQIVGKWY